MGFRATLEPLPPAVSHAVLEADVVFFPTGSLASRFLLASLLFLSLATVFAMFLSGSLDTRCLLLRGDAYWQVDCFAFSSIEHVAECHVAWLCSGSRSSSSGV